MVIALVVSWLQTLFVPAGTLQLPIQFAWLSIRTFQSASQSALRLTTVVQAPRLHSQHLQPTRAPCRNINGGKWGGGWNKQPYLFLYSAQWRPGFMHSYLERNMPDQQPGNVQHDYHDGQRKYAGKCSDLCIQQSGLFMDLCHIHSYPTNGGTTPIYLWKVNGINAWTNNTSTNIFLSTAIRLLAR